MSDMFLNMWGLLHTIHGFILSSERPRIMAILRDATRDKRPGERLRRRFMRSSTSHAAGRVLRRMFPNRTLPLQSATQRLVNLLFRALHASAEKDATDQNARNFSTRFDELVRIRTPKITARTHMNHVFACDVATLERHGKHVAS